MVVVVGKADSSVLLEIFLSRDVLEDVGPSFWVSMSAQNALDILCTYAMTDLPIPAICGQRFSGCKGWGTADVFHGTIEAMRWSY